MSVAALRSAMLADNPVGFWPLDNSVADISTGNHPLSVYEGSPAYKTDPLFGNVLDGPTGAFEIVNGAPLNQTAYAVGGWVNLDASSPQGVIYSDWGTVGGVMLMVFGDKLRAYHGSNTLESPAALPFGKWLYCSVSWDGTTRRLFIDGVQVNSIAEASAPGQHVYNPQIGNYNDKMGGFAGDPLYFRVHGEVSHVAVFSTAVSEARFRAHYTSGLVAINDNFVDAIDLAIETDGGTYVSPLMEQTYATTEFAGPNSPFKYSDGFVSGEPDLARSANRSLWWVYRPATSGTVTIDTAGSLGPDGTTTAGLQDTQIALWRVTHPEDHGYGLAQVAYDQDSAAGFRSKITNAAVTAGEIYYLQVGHFSTSEATSKVVVTATGPAHTSSTEPPPPVVTPNPPIDLTVMSVSSNAATLIWSPPETGEAPLSYEYSLNSGTVVNVGLVDQAVLSDLQSNTQQNFRVRAVGAEGSSAWTEISFSTTAGAPNPPTAVTSSAITATQATISWTAPVSGPAVLRYEYSVNLATLTDAGLSTQATLTSLEAGRSYSVRVRSVGEFGSSAWVEHSFSTLGAPSPPVNLQASNVTNSGATITWSTPASPPAPTSYEYSINFEPPVSSGLSRQLTLTELTPETSTSVRVRSIGTYGASDWAEVTFTTGVGVPEAPINLVVDEVTDTTADISWAPPSSGPLPASYEYSLDTESPVNVGSATQIGFVDLAPGSVHDLRVRSVNEAGFSAWSTISVTTTVGPPNAPVDLEVVDRTKVMAIVSWGPALTGPATLSYEYSFDLGLIADAGTTRQMGFENLLPGSIHSIRIRAVGEFGVSEWSELAFTTTADEYVEPESKRLVWDSPEDRIFETGLDRGVLYFPLENGVAWNGLTAIDEDLGDESTEPLYFDGIKFLDKATMGDFSASFKAVTYPEEFAEYEGLASLGGGLFVDDQQAKVFGLSYRTLLGNQPQGTEFGYKLHLVYNLTASPDTRSHVTLSSAPTPEEFSWIISAVPVEFAGFRPTAHIIIDTTEFSPSLRRAIEKILYGDVAATPRLPTIAELHDLIANWVTITITDHGDGTWTATGPDDLITMLDETSFQITEAEATYLDENTYRISNS